MQPEDQSRLTTLGYLASLKIKDQKVTVATANQTQVHGATICNGHT